MIPGKKKSSVQCPKSSATNHWALDSGLWTLLRIAGLTLTLLLISGCTQLDRVTENASTQVADEPQFVIVTATVALTPTARIGETHYTVQEGDTLSGIAEMFGVTWDAIIQANNLQSQDAIFVGQELLIPSPESGNATQTPGNG